MARDIPLFVPFKKQLGSGVKRLDKNEECHGLWNEDTWWSDSREGGGGCIGDERAV